MGWIKDLWNKIKGLAAQAFAAIQDAGLDDAVMALAIEAVQRAEMQFSGNVERREWVIAFLTSKGIPKLVASGALELALAFVRKRAAASQ